MELKVISIGKVRQSFVLDGEAEFLKRLKPWIKISLTELEASNAADEADLFIKQIKEKDFVVVLDEKGKEQSSQQFANFLADRMNRGTQRIIFGIGGAFGWDKKVKERADQVVSLSKMTFTYQMTRLILVEQIYRAMSIVKGQPYHK